jgi:pyrroline-5-carboxylate reductase
MGIAILSGVIASLESSIDRRPLPKWESHTPGTLTPTTTEPLDLSTPTRFIACVSRQESVKTLNETFSALPRTVEVVASRNLEAVQQSTVVLLWYAHILPLCLIPAHPIKYSCKPQLAHSILTAPGIREALEGKLLISILAGVTLSQLNDWVPPSTKVIRAMPNTPCKVRRFSCSLLPSMLILAYTPWLNVDT